MIPISREMRKKDDSNTRAAFLTYALWEPCVIYYNENEALYTAVKRSVVICYDMYIPSVRYVSM